VNCDKPMCETIASRLQDALADAVRDRIVRGAEIAALKRRIAKLRKALRRCASGLAGERFADTVAMVGAVSSAALTSDARAAKRGRR